MRPEADADDGHFYRTKSFLTLQPGCLVGLRYKTECQPTQFGVGATVRAGTVIYADVVIGDDFQTGHHVLIREHTTIGDHVTVGTHTVIDGNVSIGNFVKIESQCYIPTHVRIGNRIFLGPGVILTNDRYPLKMRDSYAPTGCVLEDGVTLGAGAIVTPGVTVGRGSFVAAGAVVTRDIPPMSLVVGVPGVVAPLPEKLRSDNMALSWRKYLDA